MGLSGLSGLIPAADPGGGLTLAQIMEAVWPVGSIYISLLPTDPAVTLGVGAWQRIGNGRALVGVDEADPLFETPGLTGGAKQVAAAGGNSQPAFLGDPLAGHSHGVGTLATSSHTGTAVGTHSYTPAGNNATVQFTPAGANATVQFTPAGVNSTV